MAAGDQLYIPKLNPIQFHQPALGDFWMNSIPDHETQTTYVHRMQVSDICFLEFLATFDLIGAGVCTLVDNTNTLIDTYTIASLGTYGEFRAYYIKETIGSYSGIHYIKLVVTLGAETITLYSEPIDIAASHTDTVEISYRHEHSKFDCIFGGIVLPMFYLRVVGGMKSNDFSPSGKFKMYNDLDHVPVMLQSQPYNIYKFTFGDARGVPNWVAERINRAFACDHTYIDNIRYMRNEGAKLERTGAEGYPMAGWSIDLLEVDNDYSDLYGYDTAFIVDGPSEGSSPGEEGVYE